MCSYTVPHGSTDRKKEVTIEVLRGKVGCTTTLKEQRNGEKSTFGCNGSNLNEEDVFATDRAEDTVVFSISKSL